MIRILLGAAAVALAATPATAATGKDVFEELRCGTCHRADRDGVAPSLESMANAYAGDRNAVAAYFRGEAPPKLDRGRAAMMKSPLAQIGELEAEGRAALAAFLAGAE